MRVLVLALLLAHASAHAAPVASRPLSIRELAVIADTVVIGRIAAIRPEAATPEPGIVTRIPVDVDQVLKGSAGAALILVQAGGERGGVAATIGGAPAFAAGEQVLLFLTRRPDGALRVAHLYQGKFSIEADPSTGASRVVRRVPDTGAVVDALPLTDALALVRAALAAPGGAPGEKGRPR